VGVAPSGVFLELRAGLYCYSRRYDDFDLWITFGNGVVGWLAVIGAIGRDLTYFMFDLVEQWPNLRRIINILLSQYRGHYQPRVGVYCKVQFPPATA